MRYVDENPFARDVLRTRRDRQSHLDAPLQHGGRDHENDEQDQHHVDERDDVDLGETRARHVGRADDDRLRWVPMQ